MCSFNTETNILNFKKMSNNESTFFKIDVGSKKSLRFYKDFLIYFGYKIKYEDATKLNFSNGETDFFIFSEFIFIKQFSIF